MLNQEFYTNVGNFNHCTNDYEFSFENGHIEIYRPTTYCDSWEYYDDETFCACKHTQN